MIARITVLGIALMAVIGVAVPAQAEDDFGRPGAYLGVGFAVGFENFDIPDYFNIDTAVGFDLWAGYRLIPNLAVEVELEYLNGFDIGIVEVDQLALTGNVKAYLLTGRFQPFAVVGIGMTHLRQELITGWSDEDFAARFGAGMDVYLTECFSVGAKASYVLTTNDLDGSDYVDLTLGGQIRF